MYIENIRQQTIGPNGRPAYQQIKANKRSDGTLELFIYDTIKGHERDRKTGKLVRSNTSAEYFQSVLAEHPNVKRINLYVNSNGGSVTQAMGIRAHLLRHPARVTAYVDGWAASAASFILTACDEIKMRTGTMQMIHSMWMITSGSAKDLRKAADDLDSIMSGNKAVYLERAQSVGGKLTAAKLDRLMDNESWLNAEECVRLGLADEVLQGKTDYPDDQKQQRGLDFLRALAKEAERAEARKQRGN